MTDFTFGQCLVIIIACAVFFWLGWSLRSEEYDELRKKNEWKHTRKFKWWKKHDE